MLENGFKKHGEDKSTTELATLILDDLEKQGQHLPGFGHPIHRPVDLKR